MMWKCFSLAWTILSVAKVLVAIEVDGSATVYASYKNDIWTVVQDINDWESNDTIVAVAKFDNDQQKTGWMYLEVKTKESAPDSVQSYGAGLVEGYLTRTYIVESYKEFFSKDVCKTNPQKCDWIIRRFKENKEYVNEQIREKSADDPYWHQVDLMYHQMQGMTEGCRLKTLMKGLDLTDMDYDMGVELLHLQADFWDLSNQYDLLHTPGSRLKRSSRPSCSVIIKYLQDDHDILMAHNTWHEYRAMGYRILKSYNINLHVLPGSAEVVPGHTISMSSYAGTIFSLDDFYLTSARLGVMETTLFVYDHELFRLLRTNGTVYEPLRVMASNRLSTNGSHWQDMFQKHNSGTYNNQWMVIDYKVLEKSKPGALKNGVLTISEQLPDQFHVEDQTKALMEPGYWASYNRAFYPEIHERAGGLAKEKEFGDWFSHGKTARANIMRRDHKKVKDLDTLMELMRYNDYERDEFAVIKGCTPERNPAGSIANRLDLYNGTCVFDQHDWMVVRSGYGALDAKIANLDSFPSLEFRAVAGPTYENHPPFKWSTTSLDTIPEFRPIDEFKFEPITHKWTMNGNPSGSNVLVPFSSSLLVLVVLINAATQQLTNL